MNNGIRSFFTLGNPTPLFPKVNIRSCRESDRYREPFCLRGPQGHPARRGGVQSSGFFVDPAFCRDGNFQRVGLPKMQRARCFHPSASAAAVRPCSLRRVSAGPALVCRCPTAKSSCNLAILHLRLYAASPQAEGHAQVEEATVVTRAEEGGSLPASARHVEAKSPALEGEVTTDTPRQPQSAFFSTCALACRPSTLHVLIVSVLGAAQAQGWRT